MQLFAGFKTSTWSHAVCLRLPFLIVRGIHPRCGVAACLFSLLGVFLCKCPVAYISTFLFMDTWLIPVWGNYESCGYGHFPTCLEYSACAAMNSLNRCMHFYLEPNLSGIARSHRMLVFDIGRFQKSCVHLQFCQQNVRITVIPHHADTCYCQNFKF